MMWWIYLGSIVSSLHVFGIFLIVISVGIGGIMLISQIDYGWNDFCTKVTKRSVLVFSLGLFLVTFMPSERVMIAMVATKLGEDIINSETGGKAGEVVNAWLDSKLKEIQEDE